MSLRINVLCIKFKIRTQCYLQQRCIHSYTCMWNKGNNKITELRTILQRESQNS
jgi:hypothetical protein